MKQFFKNTEHQKFFDENGYLILDFFDELEVKKMLDFFYDAKPDLTKGKFTSIFEWDYNLNSRFNNMLADQIGEKLLDLLPNWKFMNGSYIVKSTSDFADTNFQLHQDFNLLIESESPSIGMWIALIDTDANNGGLCVIPGSHKKFAGTIRGVNIPSLYLDIDEEVNKITRYLEVKKGQVCLFSHDLFHGSPSNSTSAIRPIIHAGIFPPSFTRIHYFKNFDSSGNEIVEELEIDHDYYSFNLVKFYENPKSGPYQLRRILTEYTPKPTREIVLETYGIKSVKPTVDNTHKRQERMPLFKRALAFIKKN